jgi:hypothetical protein
MSSNLSPADSEYLKYIVIFEYGRLGNQLFQYLAARTVAPKAQVICIGLQALRSSLHPRDCQSALSKRARLLKRLFHWLGRDTTLNLAKNRRMWGLISEEHNDQRYSIKLSKGILERIAILDGFFQNEAILDNFSYNEYPLRSDLLEKSREWIQSNVVARGLTPYFLHVRRGDYLRWPSIHHPAVLPLKWYKKQIKEITQADKRAHFIVCSDDHPYVEEQFGSHPMVSIHRGSQVDDFFLMAQCSGGGILSASTFCWWAAFYGKQFFNSSHYVAPQYWAGWRQKEWYPQAIKTSWIKYRAVD